MCCYIVPMEAVGGVRRQQMWGSNGWLLGWRGVVWWVVGSNPVPTTVQSTGRRQKVVRVFAGSQAKVTSTTGSGGQALCPSYQMAVGNSSKGETRSIQITPHSFDRARIAAEASPALQLPFAHDGIC